MTSTSPSRRVGSVDLVGRRSLASVLRGSHQLAVSGRRSGRGVGLRPVRRRRATAHYQARLVLASLASLGPVAPLSGLRRLGDGLAQDGPHQRLGPDHRQQPAGCLVSPQSRRCPELALAPQRTRLRLQGAQHLLSLVLRASALCGHTGQRSRWAARHFVEVPLFGVFDHPAYSCTKLTLVESGRVTIALGLA